MTDPIMKRWIEGIATPADEAVLYATNAISECEYEFGYHEDHSDCARMLADMSPEFDDTDYSDWYGGERGYNDGLRWSDFV